MQNFIILNTRFLVVDTKKYRFLIQKVSFLIQTRGVEDCSNLCHSLSLRVQKRPARVATALLPSTSAVPASKERSINRRHVYTEQTADLHVRDAVVGVGVVKLRPAAVARDASEVISKQRNVPPCLPEQQAQVARLQRIHDKTVAPSWRVHALAARAP